MDAAVFFIKLDGERENFSFRKIVETLCHGRIRANTKRKYNVPFHRKAASVVGNITSAY